MAKTMLINMAEPEECRIALLDNSNLEEIYLERDFEHQLVGNVYLGKVTNIEPAMQAAFVDFGGERNGFLHISDISFDSVLSEKRLEELGLVKKDKEPGPEKEQEKQGDKTDEKNEKIDQVEVPVEEEEKKVVKKYRKVKRKKTVKTKSKEEVKDTVVPVKKEEVQQPIEVKTIVKKRAKKAVKKDLEKSKVKRVAVKKSPNTSKEKEEEKEKEKEEVKSVTKTKKVKKAVKKLAKKVVKKKKSNTTKETSDNKDVSDEEVKTLRLQKKPEERNRRRSKKGNGGNNSNSGGGNTRKTVQIQDVLQKGQMILVQVSREAIDHKGAGLTTFISLAGRTLVLMPQQSKVGVSRKIQDREERQKLKDILDGLKTEKNMGFIIRTSGVGKTAQEIDRDLKVLVTRWKKIESESKKKKNISLLYEESGLAIRALRDLYTSDVKSIIIDNPEGEKKVRGWLRSMIPGVAKLLQLHQDARPLFHKFGIEDAFEKIFSRKVELPSGATLVIEQTEAMVTIDVNTARLRKEKDQNKAIFRANLEAAEEIPRQLRLRDLGGIIVCDFIDMVINDHRKQVEKTFATHVKRDRARVKFSRISQFGLIEVSRQRMRQSVERASYDDCPSCSGLGLVQKESSVALKILREIRLSMDNPKINTVHITAFSDVVDFLQNTKREKLLALEQKYETMIRLSGDASYRREQFTAQYLDMENHVIKN